MSQHQRQKSLGINALLNGIRTVLNLIFPLITFPYVARVLSVENVGKYNFALSINQYFLLIAALGVTTYAVREGAKNRENKVQFQSFANEVFSINLASTIISYALMLVSIFVIPQFQEYRVLILIFSIELIFTTIGTEWIYSIYEEYAYITIRSIAFKIISIILLFLLVKKEDDYIVYAGITVFANAGSNILNFIHARKYCRIKWVWNCNCVRHLKPILIIFASTIATSIYVNSDITMLGLMATDYEVGIYSVSSKIYRIVKQMLAAILIVSIPRLAMLMGQKKMEEYRRTLTQIFNALTIFVLPAVVGLFCMSKEVVLLISSEEYIQAEKSLRLLSIALVLCIGGWIFNQCVLIPAKKEKIVLIATLISAISNVVINFILIPVLKEDAVAISTIVAEGIMMFVCMYNGLKIVKLEKGVLQNILTVICGCITIPIICILVKALNLSSILTLCLSILGSCISYGLVLLILKNKLLIGIVKPVAERLRPKNNSNV